MPSAKKYKLHKSTDTSGSGKAVCAFWTSPDGCRNGDKCAFLHGAAPSCVAEISETASVVSSESEGEVRSQSWSRPSLTNNKPSINNGTTGSTNGQNNKNHESDPFTVTPTTPKEQPRQDPTAQKNKKRKSRSNSKSGDDLFANPKDKAHAPPVNKKPKSAEKPTQSETNQKRQDLSQKKQEVVAPVAAPATFTVPDFRNLVAKLPVASFSIPGVGDVAAIDKSRTPTNENEKKPEGASTAPNQILPTSTAEGRKWLNAVKSSRSHERYANAFDFDKYKEANAAAGLTSEWIKAKPFGKWCASNPQAIAIDCEMCETQDPLSGTKNHKALCRLSVINAENPEEVLLDTLVKPSWPVTDYRTRINGIGKEDLEKVEFTLRHAQAFMMALCSDETVIVGHAVQNDLVALNMEHYCVADSSFLFFAKDSTASSVSLKDLVASIFKVEMPDTHDSVNDARKALECVMHWVEKDGDVETIERTAKHKGNQLFVHRIPKQCQTHHLTNMFVKHTSVEPLSVDDIEYAGDMGKTHVIFRSPRHASLAFDTLEGTAEPDKSGRLQKKVFLRNGDYVRVRKMTSPFQRGTPQKTPSK